MTNIAFIPVRGGSKSIPNKNIKNIAGYPLVYWVSKAANDAKCIDKIIIATDSEIIKDTVETFNFTKLEIYNRREENAQDHSSTESVMLEYLLNETHNENDLLFLIQATSPLLKSKHIEEMYKKFLSDKADSALSCVRNKRFFWNNDGTPINYNYTKRPRRQDFEGYLMENGACYINSVKNILENKNRLSGKISTFEMPEYTGIEIDEPDDFITVEKLMEKHKND